MKRALYLACYDIRSQRRLRKALKVMKGYASGKQYSCFECYLTAPEMQQLLGEVTTILMEEDSFALLALNRRRSVITLGQGVAPVDEHCLWLG